MSVGLSNNRPDSDGTMLLPELHTGSRDKTKMLGPSSAELISVMDQESPFVIQRNTHCTLSLRACQVVSYLRVLPTLIVYVPMKDLAGVLGPDDALKDLLGSIVILIHSVSRVAPLPNELDYQRAVFPPDRPQIGRLDWAHYNTLDYLHGAPPHLSIIACFMRVPLSMSLAIL